MNFLSALQQKTLLFDGALGTLLRQRGLLAAGECQELFHMLHPSEMLQLHLEYLEAGADIITANTFGANSMHLFAYDIAHKMPEIVKSAVALCREAVASHHNKTGREAFVAVSLGPTGVLLSQDFSLSSHVYNTYFQQCTVAAAEGADLLLIETMSDLAEARLALLAARAACKLPVVISFTLEADDNTFMGNPPEVLALCCKKLGASMVGINCGLGPKACYDGFSRMAGVSMIPVFAMPAAGEAACSPSDFEKLLLPYIQSGAHAVGGCCGTGPEHIRVLRHLLDAYGGAARVPKDHEAYICSAFSRQPLPMTEHLPKAICLKGLSVDGAIECILQEKEQQTLLLDLEELDAMTIRRILWSVSGKLQTPVIFRVYSAEQAKAALYEYPGIAAVEACGDTYSVMKESAKYGAEVLI